jgi:prolyl-tRNA editing enzyme YbaK/EbsC (Cys-tRNA(Pro) deacylase)
VRTSWPEPVERVAEFLRRAGVEARLEDVGATAASAREAALAAGCALDQIVKSIVFVCDGRPVVALVPGNARADTAKLAEAAGAASIRVARGDEVLAATGFAPGAVAPFPLPRVHAVYMDRTLLAHRVVWVGAGSPQHLAAVAPDELQRLARAVSMDAVEDTAYHSDVNEESAADE